jgi:hypothetical protein
MTKKHINQLVKAKASAQLLHNNLSLITSYEELQDELNKFAKAFLRDANERNNRPNKNVIGLINYLSLENKPKRNLEAIKNKSKARRLAHKTSYKDYTEEYIILRQRGHSNQSIADYSYKHFKVKVSKETIRKLLKGLEDVTQ